MAEALRGVQQCEQLKLIWKTRRNSPCERTRMARGTAVAHGSVCYFSLLNDYDVFAYNFEKDDWSKLPVCPYRDVGLAVVNDLLTAVGGLSDGIFPVEHTNRLFSYSGSKWVTIFPPMPTKRGYTTVISAQNYLIAAGGVGEEDVFIVEVVEVMNITTRQWYTAASLPVYVYLMSATICGGSLYLLGGECDYDRNGIPTNGNPTCAVFTCSLDSLLHSCYPPSQIPSRTDEADVWQCIADVPTTLSTCTTLNGRVLAIGGHDSHGTPTADVYMYNSDSESWLLVGCMTTARNLCQVVGLKDCVIVVGSYESPSSVEVGYLQLSGGSMVIILVAQSTSTCLVLKVIHTAVDWV